MIAIISDIHGNYPALMAVLGEIDKYNCTEIISLGDVCGYYCMVNECIEELRKRNVSHLLGNHDSYIINDALCPRSKSANECLKYQKKILTPENMDWLQKAPSIYEADSISCVHGGWNNNIDEYLYEVNEKYFLERKQKFFFSGHTHIQLLKIFNSKIYCNPGSVGQPRDGDSSAAYAIFDEKNSVILKRVNYDINEIAQNMNRIGFEKKFYANLYKGLSIE